MKTTTGDLWRASWPWGLLVGAILVIRLLLDALVPVTYTAGVIHPRSSIMSYTLMAIFALSASWQTWRSGLLRSGMLAALAIGAIGGALSMAGTVMFLALRHDPQIMRAIEMSGGLDEALWGVPLLLFPIGLVTGTVGALIGKCLPRPRLGAPA